jgi:hypothetical protein
VLGPSISVGSISTYPGHIPISCVGTFELGLMDTDFTADIDAIQRIDAVPRILEIVCRSTGMGFAAVARVTDGRWICFAVRDEIEFGFTGRRVSRRNDDLSRNSTKPSSGRYRSCCRRRIFLWAPHTGPIRLCFFRSGNGDLARDVSAASPRGRMSAQVTLMPIKCGRRCFRLRRTSGKRKYELEAGLILLKE